MGEWPKVQRVLRAKILEYANRIQITNDGSNDQAVPDKEAMRISP